MIEVIGTLGGGLLLLAYFMVTTRHWIAFSVPYQLSTIVGSILLIIYALIKDAPVNVVLNSVFVAVGIFGIYKIIHKPARKRKRK